MKLLSAVLPVEKLSPDEGFWGYLAALHFVDAPEGTSWSQEEWNQYPLRQAHGKTPLDILAGELGAVPALGPCISEALMRAGLGFGRDAMLACLVTLFQVGFVDARTRGRMFGDCTMAISGLCAKSPDQISSLARLFACSYALVPATACEGLFKSLSFVGWSPDPVLIRQAQGWLVRDFAKAAAMAVDESYSTFHMLGKLVFANAPWSTMSPTLNQYAAYLIVEVMTLVKNPTVSALAPSAGAVKELSAVPRKARDEFIRWSWSVLLRLNYTIELGPPRAGDQNEGLAQEEGEMGFAQEEVDDFVVVKKNKALFKVLVPENEDEDAYLNEISELVNSATNVKYFIIFDYYIIYIHII